MTHLEYFKQQSKNLFRDWKSRAEVVEDDGFLHYKYEPKFFDVEDILFHFEIDEEKFSLMKAQHLVARIAGFRKWNDLIKVSSKELELAKIVFDNCSKDMMLFDDWECYRNSEFALLDIESKIEAAKHFFSPRTPEEIAEIEKTERKIKKAELILSGKERERFLLQEMRSYGYFKLDSEIRCIHCDSQYLFKEATVIRSPVSGTAMVMCKNYPKCDGSIIDFLDVDDDYDGFVPFDWDMDQGYSSEYDS